MSYLYTQMQSFVAVKKCSMEKQVNKCDAMLNNCVKKSHCKLINLHQTLTQDIL